MRQDNNLRLWPEAAPISALTAHRQRRWRSCGPAATRWQPAAGGAGDRTFPSLERSQVWPTLVRSQHLPHKPRSGPVPVFPDAGSDACPGRSGRPVPVAVGSCGPDPRRSEACGRGCPGERGRRWSVLPPLLVTQAIDEGLAAILGYHHENLAPATLPPAATRPDSASPRACLAAT
jgi:hypothetical protein